ncbi:MAG: AhpC/TSA family protein [Flavobacteriaceae bacterium]|nr:AhpC/TSA family protein [Flavobacteriaceae bacterium]
MFKKLLLAFLLISSFSYGQFIVKGELQSAENYPYMIMYQLQGAKQNYIAHDSIKNGKFSITIPAKQTSGIYRLIYDIKNRLFVDFIYDNENISLTLNPKKPNQSVIFTASENNKIYQNYLKKIQPIQQKLDSLQTVYFNLSDKATEKKFSNLYQKNYTNLTATQQQFEAQSTGKLVNHFIKASARYNAEDLIKSPAEYLASVKEHFFDNIDFNSKTLLNSTFINDKINDYIFHLNTSDDKKILTELYKEAITTVVSKTKTNPNFSKGIQEGLLYTFAKQENISMVNNVLNHYLQLPNELQDPDFIGDIKGQLKTAIGNIAPNILWSEDSKSKSLHMLSDSSYYLVVFWSSSCGHCLKELPLLKEYLKDKNNVEVLSIGLETEESKMSWKDETYYYPDWIHIYGKDKWKNKFVRDYGVNATPSFFILDAKKKILAKPDDVEELKVFFEEELDVEK